MTKVIKPRTELDIIIGQHRKKSINANSRVPYIAHEDIDKIRAIKKDKEAGQIQNMSKKQRKSMINAKNNKNLILSRKDVVLAGMIGLPVLIHDGRSYHLLTINENMIGHRLGEFVETRKQANHTSANKDNKSK